LQAAICYYVKMGNWNPSSTCHQG